MSLVAWCYKDGTIEVKKNPLNGDVFTYSESEDLSYYCILVSY